MSKSVSKISELVPSQIGCLTKLLNFDPNPPSTGSKDPSPRRIILTWLDMQYDWLRCGAFPEALIRPQGFHPGTIVPRIALQLPSSWVAPKAVLCEAHKPLNPFLIRRVFVQIVGECSVRLARLTDLANDLRKEEKLDSKGKGKGKADENMEEDLNNEKVKMSKNVEDWLNRILSVNALWIPKKQFRVAYPTIAADMPKRIPLPHDHTKCEACILSYIGGNSQIIFDLGVSLRARLRRGQDLREKLLWPLIDSWNSWIGETQEMKEKAAALGKEIRQVRKGLQQRRRERRKLVAQTAKTASHDIIDPPKISARFVPPLFEGTGGRKFLKSRFEEHLQSISGEDNATQAEALGRRYENYLKALDDPVTEKRDQEVDARYEEYVDRLYADIAEMDEGEAEIGEGQTELDERYYQDSILGYYRNLPTTTSIVPAPSDAYGTGEYVRPKDFSLSANHPKTPEPDINNYSFYEPSIGSGGWEDVEVIEDEPPKAKPLTLERTDTGYLQQEQGAGQPFYTIPTPSPPKDIDDVPQRASRLLSPPPANMSSRNIFSRLRFRGRETVTSKYSNASASYKPYKPTPRIQEILRSDDSLAEDPEDLPSPSSGRTSKSMSISGITTIGFNNKRQDSPSIEGQDIAEERANAYRTLVGQSPSSRPYKDANPDLETIARTYYTAALPEPLSIIFSESSVESKMPISPLSANCTVPPHPTVESVSDMESRVTHWSDVCQPKAAVAPVVPAAPFSPMPSPVASPLLVQQQQQPKKTRPRLGGSEG